MTDVEKKDDDRAAHEGDPTKAAALKEWLAIRKEAGLKIDPETAEVDWCYALTLDPYGVYPELPEDCRQVGREYFARSPESDIWVNSATSLRLRGQRCGKSVDHGWHFPQDFPLPSRTATIDRDVTLRQPTAPGSIEIGPRGLDFSRTTP